MSCVSGPDNTRTARHPITTSTLATCCRLPALLSQGARLCSVERGQALPQAKSPAPIKKVHWLLEDIMVRHVALYTFVLFGRVS
jgi:hypothetical protein